VNWILIRPGATFRRNPPGFIGPPRAGLKECEVVPIRDPRGAGPLRPAQGDKLSARLSQDTEPSEGSQDGP